MTAWSVLCDADPLAGRDQTSFEDSPALDAVVAELVASEDSAAWLSDPADGRAVPILGVRVHPLRPMVTGGLVVALVLVLAAVLVATGTIGPSRHVAERFKTAFTTPLREPRPLARSWSSPVPRDQSGWELVGDISPAGWALHTTGPEPGFLTCASVDACYAVGDNSASDSGPAEYDSLYFSDDGGESWEVLSLPSGFAFTSGLSCASSEVCYGAGLYEDTPAFITTTDGAEQWTVRPMEDEIAILACPAVGICSAVTTGTPPKDDSGYQGQWSYDSAVTFLHTDDGGLEWGRRSLPEEDAVSGMSCPGPLKCVLVGYPVDVRQGPDVYSGYSLVTADGGASFTSGSLPAKFGFDQLASISCADASHCMAIGEVTVPNPDECVGNPPGVHPPSESSGSLSSSTSISSGWCLSGSRATVSGVVSTSDGGASWQLRPLPPDVPLPGLDDVSCYSDDGCFVVGSGAIPQGTNGGSAVILGTQNQGESWSMTTFTIPPGAPEDHGGDSYMSVGSISCPGSDGCVALGVSDQGSRTTPVYSFRHPAAGPD